MNINNNRGSILLGVFLIGVTIMALIMITFRATDATTKTVKKRKENINAFNIAEAGKEIALSELRSGTKIPTADATVTFYTNQAFGGGHYTVKCKGSISLDSIWLTSTGVHGNEEAVIEAIYQIAFTTHAVNCNVDAALTARSEIGANGKFTIDGRDWKYDGSGLVSSGTGVPAIKSGYSVSIDGNASVGGSVSGIDFPPENKGNWDPAVVEEHQTIPYSTPEEILGIPAGILDGFKSKDPPSETFDGIYYYNPDDDGVAPDLNGSRGIYICHNDSYTASLQNFHSDFKGLIIADRVSHLNAGAEILGALFLLSEISGTNVAGNGNSVIKYCSQALDELASINIQSGGTNFELLSWKQVK